MNDRERLASLDRQRRQAMTQGDVAALARLLADDLLWTHSSGKQDDKAALLRKLEAGEVVYLTLEVTNDGIVAGDSLMVHRGDLQGRVLVDGREKALNNRFVAVWRRSGDDWALALWQSTGF